MKLKVYLACILIGLAGCSEDKLPDEPEPGCNGQYQFVASIENMEVETKTIVNEDGSIQWNTDESVGLYGENTSNARFKVDNASVPSASATFSGSLTEPDAAPLWAYYPYQADATTDASKQSLSLTLPDEYDYTGDTYLPMLGHPAGNQQMLFKHLTGILRLTLRNVPADAYAFVLRSAGENATPLAGRATVADVSKDGATLSVTEEAGHEITYRIGDLVPGEDTRTFFIPLPVGDYAELEIEALRQDDTVLFTRSLGAKVIGRAQIVSVPVVDFQTGEAYVLQDNAIEINEETEQYINLTSIDQTTGVCTLTYAQAPAEGMPQVGDVLLRPGISDRFPQGFLGKVTSVKETKEGYTVTTGPACLNDAFKDLVVDEEVDLVPENMETETRAIDLDGSFANFSISMDFSQGSGIYAKGAVTFGLKYHVVIDLKQQYLSYTYKNEIGVDGTAGIRGELSGDAFKHELSPGIPLGAVAIGPIPMTPRLVPSVVIRPRGTFNMSATLAFRHGTETTITYSNGKWEKKQNPISPNSKSPWDITQGDYSIEGAVFMGLSAELDVAPFQLNDFFSVGIEAQVGPEMSGKLDMAQLMTAMNKEELLSAASVTNKFILNGGFVADINILNFSEQASLSLIDVTFGETTLKVVPDVEIPEAKVEEESEDKAQAEVKTTVSQQLLTKQTTLAMELENDKGEVVQEGDAMAYKGEPEADEIPQADLQENFNGLEKDRTFTAYPTVASPLLGEEKVKLKSKSVTFSTQGGTLREQLIRMYRNTDGPNWKNNENWCTEKPLTEWYGISQSPDGKYAIQLADNNLKGFVQLNDSTIAVLILGKNELSHVNVNKCTNLQFLGVTSNHLEGLYVAECKKLEEIDFPRMQALHTLDMSESNFANLLENAPDYDRQFSSLKVLYARNLPDYTRFPMTMIRDLDTLDISGCTRLRFLSEDNEQQVVNKYANLSGCNSLFVGRDYLFFWGLEYLNITDCEDEGNDWDIEITESLKELYAANCKNLKRLSIRGPLSNLDLTGCENLQYFYGDVPNLLTLKLDGCARLDTIESFQDQLTSLEMRSFESHIKKIQLMDTQLYSLALDNCRELRYLWCNSPNVKQINVAPCNKLEYLNLRMPIPSIDLSQNAKLETLGIHETEISELDLSPCKGNLKSLSFQYNDKLLEVDVRGFNELESLYCNYSDFVRIDASGLPLLRRADIGENPNLISLKLNDCPVLEEFGVNSTGLPIISPGGTIDISNCPNLSYPEVVSQLIEHSQAGTIYACNLPQVTEISTNGVYHTTTLDVSGCSNLRKIDLRGSESWNSIGKLQSLVLNGCSGLLELDCSQNQLKTLDVSSCTKLEVLNCKDNPDLTTLTLMSGPRPFFNIFNCTNTRILHVIPDWFPAQEGPYPIEGVEEWKYEPRYTTYHDYFQDYGDHPHDKGYGWYYPNEPGCGYHRRIIYTK